MTNSKDGDEMGILLSEIAKRIGIDDSIQFIDERQFDYFARATTKITGTKCIFVADSKYVKIIDNSVSMIITTSDIADALTERNFGICIAADVKGTFFELMSEYERAERQVQHKTIIGNGCIISKKAVISEQNVIIGNNVNIGDFVIIQPNVTIGDNTIIQSGAKIGEQDFNVYSYNGVSKQIFHGGKVSIGSNVLISSGVLVGQALYSYGKTVVGDNSFIGAGTCIGHNTEVGSRCEICGNSMIGGFCKIGNNSKIFMTVTVANALSIGENVTVNVGSVVIRDIQDGKTVFGNPAREIVAPKSK